MKKKIIAVLVILSVLLNILHAVNYVDRKKLLFYGVHNNVENLSIILESLIREIEVPFEKQSYNLRILMHETAQLEATLDEMNHGLFVLKNHNSGTLSKLQDVIEHAVIEKDAESLEEYKKLIETLRADISNENGEVKHSLSLRYVLNKFDEADKYFESEWGNK